MNYNMPHSRLWCAVVLGCSLVICSHASVKSCWCLIAACINFLCDIKRKERSGTLVSDFTVVTAQPFLNLNHHHPLYWGCSGARILPLSSSLLTSATTSLGSHRHPSLPRRLFWLTSRLTLHGVRLVFEQQRKTAPLLSGPGGFSQVSSPVFSSPHLLAMASLIGFPL